MTNSASLENMELELFFDAIYEPACDVTVFLFFLFFFGRAT